MFSNQMRMTGMSGIDTDQMVRSIMMAESVRFNRLQQQRQLNIWRRDAYHSIINTVNNFHRNFLSATAQNSIRMPSTWQTSVASITSGGVASTAISLRSVSNTPRTGTVRVESVARADTIRGAHNIIPSELRANRDVNFAELADMDELTFQMSLNNGAVRTINVDLSGVTDDVSLARAINDAIQGVFYPGVATPVANPRVTAVVEDGRVRFETTVGNNAAVSGAGLRELGFYTNRAVSISPTTRTNVDAVANRAFSRENIESIIEHLENMGSGAVWYMDVNVGGRTFSVEFTAEQLQNFLDEADADGLTEDQILNGFVELVNHRLNSESPFNLFGLGLVLGEDNALAFTAGNNLNVLFESSFQLNGTNDPTGNIFYMLGFGDVTELRATSRRDADADMDFDFSRIRNNANGFSIEVTVNGERRDVSFTQARIWAIIDEPDPPDNLSEEQRFINAINERIREEFFDTEVIPDGQNAPFFAELVDGRLRFSTNSETLTATVRGESMADLGFTGAASGRTAARGLDETLGSLFPDLLTGTITINDTPVTFNPQMTVQQLMNTVNAIEGVNFSFNTITRGFTLESTNMGSANDLRIEGDRAGSVARFATAFGFHYADPNSAATRERGTYAVVYVDGIRHQRETNNFTVGEGRDAITIGLNPNTIPADANYAVFDFTLSADVEPLFNAITEFVAGFNELMTALHQAHITPRPRSSRFTFFEPLTDDQRRVMSDTEIQRWEEQAMTGMLHRSSTVRGLHEMIRRWVMEPVTLEDGTRMALSSIGITTTRNVRDGGILEIDEARLRAALENDGERIAEMFLTQSTVPESGPRNQRLQTSGIADRLFDITRWSTSAQDRSSISLFTRAGLPGAHQNSAMTRAIEAQDRRLDDMQRMLQRRENQLFARFSRMEQALMMSQNQMQAMFSMMAPGMGGGF